MSRDRNRIITLKLIDFSLTKGEKNLLVISNKINT